MTHFSEVSAKLCTTHYDDLAKANARIAELEAEVAKVKEDVASKNRDYWRWQERRGRTFTLAEELVIALGLQRYNPEDAVAMAIERVHLLDECAGMMAAEAKLDPIPKFSPSYWSLHDSDGQYVDSIGGDATELLEWAEGWYEDEPLAGKIVDVGPIWHGHTRHCVFVPRYVDDNLPEVEREIDGYDVKVFLDEDEAKVFAETVKVTEGV